MQVGFPVTSGNKSSFCCQEYETKSGRSGPGNPKSPRQSVRKNLDFEPLSTTALILEDRPAYVNTLCLRYFGCWTIPHFSFTHCQWSMQTTLSDVFSVIVPPFFQYQYSASSLQSIQCCCCCVIQTVQEKDC